MKNKLAPLFFLSLFALMFAVTWKRPSSPSYITREEPAMGTFVSITIEKKTDYKEILDAAFEKIRHLENIFSIHDPSSELSLLNRDKEKNVSPHLLELIKKSILISEKTGGAFDITSRPLTKLYRKSAEKNIHPSEEDIKKALQLVGWRNIQIRGNTVKIPGEIDMGGIAKGYIADIAAQMLKEQGIKHGLVNAGGDIYCFGKSPEKGKWRIGIQNPFDKNDLLKIIYLTDFGVATSGDYERFFFINEVKYGHIVNPFTGKTVMDFPSGITVVAENAATADGFATAFFVLGPEKSIQVANTTDNLEVFIIDSEGITRNSENFLRFTAP